MKTLRASRLLALFLAACVLAVPGRAQNPAAGTTAADEVVTLGEFRVKSSPVSEYLAAESVTGTRVATRIQDLPFAVNVVTAEFIDDFNLIEYKDQFSYVSNIGPSEVQSPAYTIRGFTADAQLRNGFRRIGLIDKVNVDRIEVIKGPAASIYGAVVPGGAVNVITRRPLARPEQRVSFSTGNLATSRAQLSSTGPVGGSDRLYYRFDGAWYSREFKTKYRQNEQTTGALQLLYKISRDTSVLLEVERLQRNESANTSATIPFIVESRPIPWQPTRTYNHYVRLADRAMAFTGSNGVTYQIPSLFSFNTQGPATFTNRWVNNANLTFEHRLNGTFSLRTGANLFRRDAKRIEVGSRDQYNPITGAVQRGTARFRPTPEEGGGVQNDLLSAFTAGGVKHKVLFTVDYQQQSEHPRRWNNTSSAFPTAVQTGGLSVANPDYSFTSYYQNAALYTMDEDAHNTTDVVGLFLSERATLLEERLNLMLGLRHDRVKTRNRNYLVAPAAVQSLRSRETTYQVGANYRVLPAVTVFASTSTSFLPQPGTGFRINSAGTGVDTFGLPNETGRGYEAGLKLGLLNQRLNLTLSGFDIKRTDVVQASVSINIGTTAQTITPINTESARGIDLDFNYVLTEEFQIFGAYGYNNAEVRDSDFSRWLIGARLRRAPQHNGGIAFKYEFKHGALRGFFCNAGFKYYGDSQANPGSGQAVRPADVTAARPFLNLKLPSGLLPFPQFPEGASLTSIPYTVTLPSGRERVLNDAYHAFDAGLGYKWKQGRFSHRVQANASNLTDERFTYGSSAAGDPLMYSMTYELRF
ncbi:MAG: TonB-dependent receptor [Verrucomicrobia bacterium]|nr:TonB-dependent receptor [Verrucomicrobiota bacterium]